MPNIATILGIKIMMIPKDHQPPHVHTYYSGYQAKYNVLTGELMDGYLPSKQERTVKGFLRDNKEQLLEMWNSQIFKKL